jgi:hypothetical protein
MTSKPADDYDALRHIVDTLKPFDPKDQERIIRWAREKLGLMAVQDRTAAQAPTVPLARHDTARVAKEAGRPKDIKAFIDTKNPQSDAQFAAAVAYYYQFEAPDSERKLDIVKDDLQEATRKVGRTRLKRPGQTLVNAHHLGYFDKADRGHYRLNTVGENLVAMTLPQQTTGSARRVGRANRSSGTKKKK